MLISNFCRNRSKILLLVKVNSDKNHWRTIFILSITTENMHTLWLSNFTFRYITKELETSHQINIYRPMLIAVLFTIAKRWKETICPPTDERINKRWHIHTMKYLPIKRSKYWYTTMCMNPLNMLCEISQIENVTYYVIPFVWNIQNRWI